MDDEFDEFDNSGCLSWGVLTLLFCMLATGLVIGLLVTVNQLL
jgi:hypothetical protein